MPQRTRIEALRIVFNCASQYEVNLENKNVLFITTQGEEAVSFETLFMPHNFMHLTGIESKLNAELFYRAAISRRLSEKDITLPPNGTADLKLDILPNLMYIHRAARMVGDYDNSQPLLITDKFAGTVTMAMGFIYANDIYVPNTALKMDIRDISQKATRRKVAAIFVKPRNDIMYNQLTYIARGMAIDDDVLAPTLQEKVDIENLSADFPIQGKPIE